MAQAGCIPVQKLHTEILPFRVEIASPEQMEGVIQLRAACYGKHLPELGAKLREPEAADFEAGCEVFVATSKLDGSVLGTLRTHANLVKALPLQHSLKLPARFHGNRMVEATRLCVKGNPHSSLVRSTLFKALHSYCLEQNVDHMMATGRRPVDRIYDSLHFCDVGEAEVFYPMTFTGGVPHRVMHLAPRAAQSLWYASQHSLYQFVFETHHPDINLSGAQNLLQAWECPEIEAPHMTEEDEHPPLRDMRTPWQPMLAFAH
jgi:hypothetical protein